MMVSSPSASASAATAAATGKPSPPPPFPSPSSSQDLFPVPPPNIQHQTCSVSIPQTLHHTPARRSKPQEARRRCRCSICIRATITPCRSSATLRPNHILYHTSTIILLCLPCSLSCSYCHPRRQRLHRRPRSTAGKTISPALYAPLPRPYSNAACPGSSQPHARKGTIFPAI
jgi:hypothetical protein